MKKPASFHAMAVQVLDSGMPLWEAEKRFRDALELEALNRTRGHQGKAAQLLGIHRNTLGRKLDGTALRRKRPRRLIPEFVARLYQAPTAAIARG